MKSQIIELLKNGAQSEDTSSKSLFNKEMHGSYLTFILDVIPAAFNELKKDGVIEYSHSAVYDCGSGNGLAVEHFYKLV